MKFFLKTIIVVCILAFALAFSAQAEPTTVKIRVLSQDAKVVGSGVGGVRVTIKDISTGDILFKDMHYGGTGDTKLIMQTPFERHSNRFPGDNAAFVKAVLDLKRPTVVEISAEGPLGYPQAVKKASITTLLIPGQDNSESEGFLLTLHGFIVDIMSPESVDSFAVGSEIPLQASVRMMCGCPTQPGGLWNCDEYVMQALLLHDGTVLTRSPMAFSGKTNIYNGKLIMPDGASSGAVEIVVLVSQPKMSNYGMDSVIIKVRK